MTRERLGLLNNSVEYAGPFSQDKFTEKRSKAKTIAVIIEIALVLALTIVWFSSSPIRQSKNLWVLFFYNFASQFLVAIVPHEPVFFYFSKFFPALTVTSVSIIATLFTEYINYSIVKYFSDFSLFKKLISTKFVRRLVDFFKVAPMTALLVAALTPIPFYPFRFLVVIAEYPLSLYLLAVFIARSIRFYIFAIIGHSLQIPDSLLLLSFIVLLIIGIAPALKGLYSRHRKKRSHENRDNG